MRKPLDLRNVKIGHLTAVRPIGKKQGAIVWLIRCDCGSEITKLAGSFNSGRYTHCNKPTCPHNDLTGITDPYLYQFYYNHKERFKNPQEFLNVVGVKRPSSKYLIRKNPNKPFDPNNIHWTNIHPTARKLTHNNTTLSQKEWLKLFGISKQRLHQRLARGETFEQIARHYLGEKND